MQPVSDFSTIAAGTKLGVKASDLPYDCGKGLFTFKKIREGRRIGEYFGTIIEKDFNYGGINDLITSYSMGNHDSSYIYCAFSMNTRAMICMTGYINDPLDDSMCNVRPVWQGDTCYIVAVRDIQKGEELLMAYGAAYWMRLIWSSAIIKAAWDNYGVRRTNIQWRVLYTRTLELEAEGEFSEYEVEDSDDEVNEDGGETRVVFRSETVQRILMDFTQGEEPVITVIQVAVTPDVEPEPPAVVPYIQESSEADMVVHSTCA
jgi:hypothetical protein